MLRRQGRSAGRRVRVGDRVETVSWCLTHTGCRRDPATRRAEGPARLLLAAAAALLAPPVAAPRRARAGSTTTASSTSRGGSTSTTARRAGASRAALRGHRRQLDGPAVTWYQADAPVERRRPPSRPEQGPQRRPHPRGHPGRPDPRPQVMVKPHVDALNGQWRGDFNPSNPDAWFQSYTQFIVRYAQIAQEESVGRVRHGHRVQDDHRRPPNDPRWTAVITAVRNVYSGLLTYAANATFPADEFAGVAFWDQLDVIGLDGYFNLTNLDNPTRRAAHRGLDEQPQRRELGGRGAEPRQLPRQAGHLHGDRLQEHRPHERRALELRPERRPRHPGAAGLLRGGVHGLEPADLVHAGLFWWAWAVPTPPAPTTPTTPRGRSRRSRSSARGRGRRGPASPCPRVPASLSVNRGASGTSTIAITRTGGFTSAVDLSASGAAHRRDRHVQPRPHDRQQQHGHVHGLRHGDHGHVPVLITGTGGGLTRTTTVTLTVNPAQNFTLSATPVRGHHHAGRGGRAPARSGSRGPTSRPAWT